MDGLYIILIIKACRIRIEPCRLDDTLEKQRSSIPNEPLVKSWAKYLPSILKRIQFGVEVIWIYGFGNTIFIKVGNSRPVDISDEESFLSAIFRPVFGRRSAIFYSSCFIKWRTHIKLHKPGIIVFNPVKIADSKSTPMKLIFF